MCQIGGWNCFWRTKAILGTIEEGVNNARTARYPARQGLDRSLLATLSGRTGGLSNFSGPPIQRTSTLFRPRPMTLSGCCPTFGCDWRHMAIGHIFALAPAAVLALASLQVVALVSSSCFSPRWI